MKTNLLTRFMVVALLVSSLFANAQSNGNGNGNGNGGNTGSGKTCAIDNISVEVLGTPTGSGTTCNASVNLYFVANLAGAEQKFLTFHIWSKANYPGTPYLEEGKSPNEDDYQGALATVELTKKGRGQNWEIASITGPGSQPIPFNQDQLIVLETEPNNSDLERALGYLAYFQVRNLNISLPVPCTALDLNQFVVDAWGSWTGNNKIVSCLNSRVPLVQCSNDPDNNPATPTLPSFSGVINCQVFPRSYSVVINNSGNCRPFFVDYKVYLDLNRNFQIDAEDLQVNKDIDQDGDGLYDNVSIVAGNQTVTTSLRPVEGLSTQSLLIKVDVTTIGNNGFETNTLVFPENENQPFLELVPCQENIAPVKYKSFNAARNNQNTQQINLTWETAQEQANKGFHLQRKTDGAWQTIAFVFSAAHNGNSTEAIRYAFKDNNNFRGVTQYRLLQEDMDGAGTYSEVKTVRGLDQTASVVVYPNPATNGVVNLLFADAGARDVIISDMSGRVVKQYREVANNNLTVTGLNGGFYTIKITDRKTAAVAVEKVVVK